MSSYQHAGSCDRCGVELAGMVVDPWSPDDGQQPPVVCPECAERCDGVVFVKSTADDEPRWYPDGDGEPMSP